MNTHMSWFRKIFTSKVQMMPNPLTHEIFLEFVVRHPFAVVHFWAPWNTDDRLMSELLTSHVTGKLSLQIAFASFNIDLPAHLELARQHKVFDVPFLAFYRNGLLVQTTTGMQTPGTIKKYLRELTSPPYT